MQQIDSSINRREYKLDAWDRAGIPYPGTDEAIQRGCTCPVLDNCHGHGYEGQYGVYVITGGCPLHDSE